MVKAGPGRRSSWEEHFGRTVLTAHLNREILAPLEVDGVLVHHVIRIEITSVLLCAVRGQHQLFLLLLSDLLGNYPGNRSPGAQSD
jgi:hypothetical protein